MSGGISKANTGVVEGQRNTTPVASSDVSLLLQGLVAEQQRLAASGTEPAHSTAPLPAEVRASLAPYVALRAQTDALRRLPHLLALQKLAHVERCEREVYTQQEAMLRATVVCRRAEERLRVQGRFQQQRHREALEELKSAHSSGVRHAHAGVNEQWGVARGRLEAELRVVPLLQPTLSILPRALVQARDGDMEWLGKMLEVEQRLAAALRRVTGETAASFWLKHLLAASYNVNAIASDVPYRATVETAPQDDHPAAPDEQYIVIREHDTATPSGRVVAYASTRHGADAADIEQILTALVETPVPWTGAVFLGMLWVRTMFATALLHHGRVSARCGSDAPLHPPIDTWRTSAAFGGAAMHEIDSHEALLDLVRRPLNE